MKAINRAFPGGDEDLRLAEATPVLAPSSLSAELAALITETEAAVNNIIDVAEALKRADFKTVEEYREFNGLQARALLEASGFQDLTGQRTSRVVAFLDQLGRQLLSFSQWLGQGASHNAAQKSEPPMEKMGQADVDSLFD